MARRRTAGDGKRPMVPLGEVLSGYLKSSGLQKGVERAAVIEEWSTLVGAQIAAVTTPESVSPEGVLRVRVTTAPWAAELSLMTPKILAKINASRKGRINGIRWVPLGPGPTM
jgi:predicted nucleic acid-binding Zn ribbon protein